MRRDDEQTDGQQRWPVAMTVWHLPGSCSEVSAVECNRVIKRCACMLGRVQGTESCEGVQLSSLQGN